MEVFSRSVVLVFLLVLLTLVKGQNVVLDCNGKRTICVGPLHYLPCVDKGNGKMESVDGLAQICPVGTECSTMGPESCIPIENNPTAAASETIPMTPTTQVDASLTQTRAIQTTNTIQPSETKSEATPILEPLINPVVIPSIESSPGQANVDIKVEPTQGAAIEQPVDYTPYARVPTSIPPRESMTLPAELTAPETVPDAPFEVPAQETIGDPAEQPQDILTPTLTDVPIEQVLAEAPAQLAAEVPVELAVDIPAQTPLEMPVDKLAANETLEPLIAAESQTSSGPTETPIEQVASDKVPTKEIIETPAAEVNAGPLTEIAAQAPIEIPVEETAAAEAQSHVWIETRAEAPAAALAVQEIVKEPVDLPAEEILEAPASVLQAPFPEVPTEKAETLPQDPINAKGEEVLNEVIQAPIAEQTIVSEVPAQEIIETSVAEAIAGQPMDAIAQPPMENRGDQIVNAEVQPQGLIEVGAETPVHSSPPEIIAQQTVDIPVEQSSVPLTSIPAEVPVDKVPLLQEPVQVAVSGPVETSKDSVAEISMDIPAERVAPPESIPDAPAAVPSEQLLKEQQASIPQDIPMDQAALPEELIQVAMKEPVEAPKDSITQISSDILAEKVALPEVLPQEPATVISEQLLTEPTVESASIVAVSPVEETSPQQPISFPDQTTSVVSVDEMVRAPAEVKAEAEPKKPFDGEPKPELPTIAAVPQVETQNNVEKPIENAALTSPETAIENIQKMDPAVPAADVDLVSPSITPIQPEISVDAALKPDAGESVSGPVTAQGEVPLEQTVDKPSQAASIANVSSSTPDKLTPVSEQVSSPAESFPSPLQAGSTAEVLVNALPPVVVTSEVPDKTIIEQGVEPTADGKTQSDISVTPEEPAAQLLDTEGKIVGASAKDPAVEEKVPITETKVTLDNVEQPLTTSTITEPQISADKIDDTVAKPLQPAESMQEVIGEAPSEPEPTLPTYLSGTENVNPTGKVYLSGPGVTITQLALPTAAIITTQSSGASGIAPVDVRIVDPAADPSATADVGGEPYVESPLTDSAGVNLEATPPAGVEVMDAPTTGTSAVATLPPVEIGTIPDAAFVTPTMATNQLQVSSNQLAGELSGAPQAPSQTSGGQPEALVTVETAPKGEIINIIDPSKFIMAGSGSVAVQSAPSSVAVSGGASTLGASEPAFGVASGVAPAASGVTSGAITEKGSGATLGAVSGPTSEILSGASVGQTTGVEAYPEAATGFSGSSFGTAVPSEGIAIGANEILSGISFAGGPIMSTGLTATSPQFPETPLSGSSSPLASSSSTDPSHVSAGISFGGPSSSVATGSSPSEGPSLLTGAILVEGSASATGSILAESPSLATGSIAAETPSLATGSILAESPSSAIGSVVAEAPSSATPSLISESPLSPTSSILPESPSSATGSILAESPSSTTVSIAAETPSSAIGSILAESPSSATGSVLTGTPSLVSSLAAPEIIDTSVIQIPSVTGSAPIITNAIPSDTASVAGTANVPVSAVAPEISSSAGSSGSESSGASGTLQPGSSVSVDPSAVSVGGVITASEPASTGAIGPETSGLSTVEAGAISGSTIPTGEAGIQSSSPSVPSAGGASGTSEGSGGQLSLSSLILGGITTVGAEPPSTIGTGDVAAVVDTATSAGTSTLGAAEPSGISTSGSTAEPVDSIASSVSSSSIGADAIGTAVVLETLPSGSFAASEPSGVSETGAGIPEVGGLNVETVASSGAEPSKVIVPSAGSIDLAIPAGIDAASPAGAEVASAVVETSLAEPSSSAGLAGSGGVTVTEVVTESASGQSSAPAPSDISTAGQSIGVGFTPSDSSGTASSGGSVAEPSGAGIQLLPSGTPEPSTIQPEAAQLGQLPIDSIATISQSAISPAPASEIGGSASTGVIAVEPSVDTVQLIPSGTPGPETIGVNEIPSISSATTEVPAEESTVSIKSPPQSSFQLPSSSFIIAGAAPVTAEATASQTDKVTEEVQKPEAAIETATVTEASKPASAAGSVSETLTPSAGVSPQSMPSEGIEVSGPSPQDPAGQIGSPTSTDTGAVPIGGITFGGLDASGGPIISIAGASAGVPETGVSVDGVEGTVPSTPANVQEATGVSVGVPSIAPSGDPTNSVGDGITFGGVESGNIAPVSVSTSDTAPSSSGPSSDIRPADPVEVPTSPESPATSSTSSSSQAEIAAKPVDTSAIGAGDLQTSSPSGGTGVPPGISEGTSSPSSGVSIGSFDGSGAPVLTIGGISVVGADTVGSSSSGSGVEIKPALAPPSPEIIETAASATAEQLGSGTPISTDPAASSSSSIVDTVGKLPVETTSAAGPGITGSSVVPISGITFGSSTTVSVSGGADLPSNGVGESASVGVSSDIGSTVASVTENIQSTSGTSIGSSVGISSGSFGISGISIAGSPSPSDVVQSSSSVPSSKPAGTDGGISLLPGSLSISGSGGITDPSSSILPGLTLPAGSISVSTTDQASEQAVSELAGSKPSSVGPSEASGSEISIISSGISPGSIITGTGSQASSVGASDTYAGGFEAGGVDVALTQNGVAIDGVGTSQSAASYPSSAGQAVGPTIGIVHGIVGAATPAGATIPFPDHPISTSGFVHSGITPQVGITLPAAGATLVSGTVPISQGSTNGNDELEEEASDENLSGDVQGFSTDGDVYFDYDYTWFTHPYTRTQVQPVPTQLTKGDSGKSSEEIASGEAVVQNNSGETEEKSVEVTVADSNERESIEISGEDSNEAQSASVENLPVKQQISLPEIETQQGSGTANVLVNTVVNVQALATDPVQSSVTITQNAPLDADLGTSTIISGAQAQEISGPQVSNNQEVISTPLSSQDVVPEVPLDTPQPNADIVPAPEAVFEMVPDPAEPTIFESAIASSALEIKNHYQTEVIEPSAASGTLTRAKTPSPIADDLNVDIDNVLIQIIETLMSSKAPTASFPGTETTADVVTGTGEAAGTISIPDPAPDGSAALTEAVAAVADTAATLPEATTTVVAPTEDTAIPSNVVSAVEAPVTPEQAVLEQKLPSAPAAESPSSGSTAAVAKPASSDKPTVLYAGDKTKPMESTQKESSTEGDDQESGSEEEQQSGEDDETVQDDGSNEGSVQAEDEGSQEPTEDDDEQVNNDSGQDEENEDESAQQSGNDDDSEDESRERKLRKKRKKEAKKETKKIEKQQARIQKIIEEQDRMIEEKLKREAEEQKRKEEKERLQMEMQMKREDQQFVTNREMEINEMKIQEQAEKEKLQQFELQHRLKLQSTMNQNLFRALKQHQEDFEIARAYINNREKLVKLAKKVYHSFGMSANDQKFQCTEPGYFADPENCRKYYICYSRTGSAPAVKSVHLECPSHELFDTRSSICGHYKEAVCADEKYFKVFNGRQ